MMSTPKPLHDTSADRSTKTSTMPVLLYRYMYRIGARATFRHHARAEEALQHSSLIATEELTELLKPVVSCPSNIFRCDTRPAKPLDLCLVDLYQNPDLCCGPGAAIAACPTGTA